MKKKTVIIFFTLVLIILGIFLATNNPAVISKSVKPNLPTITTVTPILGQLDTEEQSIDKQLQQLEADSSAIDEGLNDKMMDLIE